MSFSVRERLLEPRPGPTALARPRRVPLHATEKETPRHWGNNPKVAIFSSFTGPFPRHMAQRRPPPRRAAPDGWRRACRRPAAVPPRRAGRQRDRARAIPSSPPGPSQEAPPPARPRAHSPAPPRARASTLRPQRSALSCPRATGSGRGFPAGRY